MRPHEHATVSVFDPARLGPLQLRNRATMDTGGIRCVLDDPTGAPAT